jgi:hypothetical protein
MEAEMKSERFELPVAVRSAATPLGTIKRRNRYFS